MTLTHARHAEAVRIITAAISEPRLRPDHTNIIAHRIADALAAEGFCESAVPLVTWDADDLVPQLAAVADAIEHTDNLATDDYDALGFDAAAAVRHALTHIKRGDLHAAELFEARRRISELARIADQAEKRGRELERQRWYADTMKRARAQQDASIKSEYPTDQPWHDGAHAALYWLAQDMRNNATTDGGSG